MSGRQLWNHMIYMQILWVFSISESKPDVLNGIRMNVRSAEESLFLNTILQPESQRFGEDWTSAEYLSRSAAVYYMRIEWQTVGNCVSRALYDLEPECSRRLNGLVNIGIDETNYRKGHKYITVAVNHDTNFVVWVADGHGKAVLEQFYRSLTLEQTASIKAVTGDGAR